MININQMQVLVKQMQVLVKQVQLKGFKSRTWCVVLEEAGGYRLDCVAHGGLHEAIAIANGLRGTLKRHGSEALQEDWERGTVLVEGKTRRGLPFFIEE